MAQSTLPATKVTPPGATDGTPLERIAGLADFLVGRKKQTSIGIGKINGHTRRFSRNARIGAARD